MDLKIRLLDDPTLRMKSANYPFPASEEAKVWLDKFLSDMNTTMRAASGMGLAAIQVGHPIRLFILKNGDDFKEFLNPEVLEIENPVVFENEGCLSIPDASASTTRFEKVKLKWFDRTGAEQQGTFMGMEAFAVQHEMDHLDGKLYIDQLKSLKREMVIKKYRKHMKMEKRR